jgi:outer membrane receptor protein involved in Fe transport
LSGYARQSTGSTRVSIETGKLENLGTLNVVGTDIMANTLVIDAAWKLRFAGAYNYIRARSNTSGDADALDRLPAHRGEVSAQLAGQTRWSLRWRGRGYSKSLDQGQTLSGAFLMDASASYNTPDGWLLAANLDDALNRRPLVRNGYLAAGRSLTVSVSKTW